MGGLVGKFVGPNVGETVHGWVGGLVGEADEEFPKSFALPTAPISLSKRFVDLTEGRGAVGTAVGEIDEICDDSRSCALPIAPFKIYQEDCPNSLME